MGERSLVLSALAACLWLGGTCAAPPERPLPPPPAAVLAYCAGCHLLPHPSDLPARTWREDVLPQMGALHGIYPEDNRRDYLLKANPAPRLVGLFPETRLIDPVSWDSIVRYYVDNAPAALPAAAAGRRLRSLTQFLPRPVFNTEHPGRPPLVTFIGLDTTDGTIAVGSAGVEQGLLTTFSPDHKTRANRPVPTQPTDVDFMEDLVLELGSFLPTDAPLGRLTDLSSGRPLLDSLLRPTKMVRADLDRDGEQELIVAEFGYRSGRLAAYTTGAGKQMQPAYLLEERPGAAVLRLADLDGDGAEDLVVLYGQGDEGIVVHYARAGGPERRVLLRLPATYGSSDLAVADVNADGHPDLIATNGDNYDYAPVPKPYHGVRIYANDGRGNFSEAYFFPLDGAYHVEVADFNGDSLTDLAAVAYFIPEALREDNGFVYLQRSGGAADFTFVPYGFAKAPGTNFMTMAAGDVDRDGDVDLLLGNFTHYLPEGNLVLPEGTLELPAYFFLENQLR